MCSTAAEVLYLDADAYCVADPVSLFEQLDAAPFVFWEDLPRMDGCVRCSNVWPDGPGGVPTVQGGQLVIDRVRAAKLLQVAHWICQHSDYYFAHIYGDQDARRVALAATQFWHVNLGAAYWNAPASVCYLNGAPAVVHRCQGKLFFAGRPVPCPLLPLEDRVFCHFYDLLA